MLLQRRGLTPKSEFRNPKSPWSQISLVLARILSMGELGKVLIFFGVILVAVGLLLVVGGRIHLPIGRLPGDIVFRGKNTTFYFPLVTSILVSIVLSLILYLIGRFTR